MFWLTAIVRPFKLSEVYEQLIDCGVGGMTVTEVKGFGNQKSDKEIYRGNEYTSRFLPKVKIEMAINIDILERVTQTILDASQTGKPGDGKIFVFKLENAVRIRTGEIDLEAI
jgi:nitrogen regulatory protein PII